MKTYPLINKKKGDGPFAFEIENAYVGRGTIARLLAEVEGVTDVYLRGRFGSSDDIRVEFKYLNRDYVVLEPYGDNSRYWIGPKDSTASADDIDNVENAFKHHRPPFHREIIGDILTLRLFKRLMGRG